MIRHTVTFRLKHPSGSIPEHDFLAAATAILAKIPGVERFECLRQVGARNTFTWGLSMEFASPQAYRGYHDHPEHARFVQARWIPEVAEFIELDYTPYVPAAAAR